MKYFKEDDVVSLLGSAEGKGTVSFVNHEGNEGSMVTISNLLNVHSKVDLSSPLFDSHTNAIAFRTTEEDNGTSLTIDLSQTQMEESLVPTTAFKQKDDLHGVIYIPSVQLFGQYNAQSGVIILPDNSVVPRVLRAGLLKDSKGIYQKFAKTFIPRILAKQEVFHSEIRASQGTRGFKKKPKVGDKVTLRPFQEMVEAYGSDSLPLNDDTLITVVKAATSIYGTPRLAGIEYLSDETLIIKSIDSNGIVELTRGGVSSLTLPDIGLTDIGNNIVLHETFFLKS